MDIDVEGGRLYAEQCGDGPDVVLVHGRGQSSARVWNSLLPELTDRFRVTTYDQRGCFRSTDRSSDQSVERHAKDLIALLDVLGIERAQLVGFSFGGLIVQEAAFREPQRVSSVVLMCTTCGVKPETYDDYRTRADRVQRDGMKAYVDQGIARVLSPRYIRERPAETEEYRRQFLQDDPAVYADAMRAMTRWSGCERLAGTSFPLQVIAADGDDSPITAHVALAAAEEIVRLRPDARFDVIRDSRHYVQLEQLDQLVAAMRPFLEQCAAA